MFSTLSPCISNQDNRDAARLKGLPTLFLQKSSQNSFYRIMSLQEQWQQDKDVLKVQDPLLNRCQVERRTSAYSQERTALVDPTFFFR